MEATYAQEHGAGANGRGLSTISGIGGRVEGARPACTPSRREWHTRPVRGLRRKRYRPTPRGSCLGGNAWEPVSWSVYRGRAFVRPGSTVRPSDGSAAAESMPSWRRGKRPIRGPRGRRRSGLGGECQLSAAGHRRAHRAGAKQWHPSLWQARIAIDLPAGILTIGSPFC